MSGYAQVFVLISDVTQPPITKLFAECGSVCFTAAVSKSTLYLKSKFMSSYLLISADDTAFRLLVIRTHKSGSLADGVRKITPGQHNSNAPERLEFLCLCVCMRACVCRHDLKR